MIEFNPKIKSLGIGLTNKCNLNCPHCYSRNLPWNNLTLFRLKKILHYFPNVEKVNFGTGECILNPQLIKVMDYFREKKIKMALTSNGTTVAALNDEHLSCFDDIDLSLDFPCQKLHDQFRSPGTFEKVLQALEHCRSLGINTSIALCLMNNNYRCLPSFRQILDRFKICLRINIYKPTAVSDRFSLSFNQFWESMWLLAENFYLVSTSEPILSLITKNWVTCGSPCGEQSVRIHPNGIITPCVFVTNPKLSIRQFCELKRKIPPYCQNCCLAKKCQGGCFSQRLLKNRIDQPDEFCPFPLGKNVPDIRFTDSPKPHPNFIHQNYLCTTIVC